METKKDFEFYANGVTAIVDFVKWTSSFGRGVVEQMEIPMEGARLNAVASELFALASDELGWMLVMHEREGAWLCSLPIAEAYVGFTDGVLLATEPITLFEQSFPTCGIDIFIPQFFLRDELTKVNLLGFGLYREAKGTVERVNRLIPLYNPATYELLRKQTQRSGMPGLFSQTR